MHFKNILFHYCLSQEIGYSFPCCTVESGCLRILNVIVFIHTKTWLSWKSSKPCGRSTLKLHKEKGITWDSWFQSKINFNLKKRWFMKKLPGIHGIDIPNLRVKIAQWFFNKNWESGNIATSCIGKILVNCYSQSDISLCCKWLTGKESAWQCRRHMRWVFNPWVAKILWRRKWQITPVFFPGKSHEQRSLVGYGVANSMYMGLQRVEHDYAHPLIHVSAILYDYIQQIDQKTKSWRLTWEL